MPPVTDQRITVLLADDHPLVRRGFRRMLEDDPEIVVVAEASDGEEAVRMASALRPAGRRDRLRHAGDERRRRHPRDPARRARHEGGRPAACTRRTRSSVRPSSAGARGYVLKSAIDLDLAAVGQARGGWRGRARSAADGAGALKGDRGSGLTPRELQVLQLICDGKSNREIAAVLELSVNTVAVHRANIMNALGIHKTAELVVYAIRNGLVTLS